MDDSNVTLDMSGFRPLGSDPATPAQTPTPTPDAGVKVDMSQFRPFGGIPTPPVKTTPNMNTSANNDSIAQSAKDFVSNAPGSDDPDHPLTSYGAATRAGFSSIAEDTIGAIKGAVGSLNPQPQTDEEKEALKSAGIGGMLIYRMLDGMGHPFMSAPHLAAAVHDINQSKDPMGTYLELAKDISSEGAGQALTALMGEGAGKAVKATKTGIRMRIAPTTEATPAGAQIPVRPETTMGKAAWAGTPETAQKFAQTRTSPAI